MRFSSPIAWRRISERQQRLADYLQDKKEIRFVTPQGTDITLAVAGRRWINCDGHENFPDGEVFTAPVRDSINGVIRFNTQSRYQGTVFSDIMFEFKNGKIVKATVA